MRNLQYSSKKIKKKPDDIYHIIGCMFVSRIFSTLVEGTRLLLPSFQRLHIRMQKALLLTLRYLFPHSIGVTSTRSPYCQFGRRYEEFSPLKFAVIPQTSQLVES